MLLLINPFKRILVDAFSHLVKHPYPLSIMKDFDEISDYRASGHQVLDTIGTALHEQVHIFIEFGQILSFSSPA